MKRSALSFVCVLMSCVAAARGWEKKPAVDVAPLVAGNSQFACELFGQLASQDGNLFYSPDSISSALALAYLGAGGSTAEEMQRVLHFDLAGENLHAAFAQLTLQLSVTGSQNCQLVLANRLWAKQGLRLAAAYEQSAQAHYGAALERVDFERDPDAAARTINAWVAQQTQKKITRLLSSGDLDPTTELVLTNAIYFKGRWSSPFEAGDSAESPFTLASGEQVPTVMMHQTGGYRMAQLADFTALELPYEGGQLAMIVLLPKRHDGVEQLESQLSAERLSGWLAQFQHEEVRVSLPRFKVSQRFVLNDPLQSLGLASLFAPGQADLSRMTGGKDLYVSKVVHEAVVEVNEEGTVAAAATAAVAARPSPLPLQFMADHPFLFLIRHQPTGALLFVGRLADPSSGG